MFKDHITCKWDSPHYFIDIPLKKDYKITLCIPDEYQKMIGDVVESRKIKDYTMSTCKPYIKVLDEKSGNDVTEMFLKKVDRTIDVSPSSRNLWTIIDVVHCALQINEGGDR